ANSWATKYPVSAVISRTTAIPSTMLSTVTTTSPPEGFREVAHHWASRVVGICAWRVSSALFVRGTRSGKGFRPGQALFASRCPAHPPLVGAVEVGLAAGDVFDFALYGQPATAVGQHGDRTDLRTVDGGIQGDLDLRAGGRKHRDHTVDRRPVRRAPIDHREHQDPAEGGRIGKV